MRLLTPFILLTFLQLCFLSGIAFGNFYPNKLSIVQKQQLPATSQQSATTSAESLTKQEKQQFETKDIVIVFTVDESKRIKVLNVSGGHNLLTSYIRQSLDGRMLESGNVVPGINYVMTLKFPASV